MYFQCPLKGRKVIVYIKSWVPSEIFISRQDVAIALNVEIPKNPQKQYVWDTPYGWVNFVSLDYVKSCFQRMGLLRIGENIQFFQWVKRKVYAMIELSYPDDFENLSLDWIFEWEKEQWRGLPDYRVLRFSINIERAPIRFCLIDKQFYVAINDVKLALNYPDDKFPQKVLNTGSNKFIELPSMGRDTNQSELACFALLDPFQKTLLYESHAPFVRAKAWENFHTLCDNLSSKIDALVHSETEQLSKLCSQAMFDKETKILNRIVLDFRCFLLLPGVRDYSYRLSQRFFSSIFVSPDGVCLMNFQSNTIHFNYDPYSGTLLEYIERFYPGFDQESFNYLFSLIYT